jgi:hypothetical protein
MKSAAKRDNYCELQDILSSNNLNANGGFGYSWSHVRLRVDIMKIQTNICSFIAHVDTWILQSNHCSSKIEFSILAI